MREWNIQMKPDGRTFGYIHDEINEVMHCNPIPTDDELSYWYQTCVDYNWFDKRASLKKIQAWHRWFIIGKKIDLFLLKSNIKPTILDIGCGHGWFLSSTKKSNFDTYGIDFKSIATINAKKAGHTIFEGSFMELDIPKSYFNVITMWHSLEHTTEPSKILEKAKECLTPDGILMIAVPNLVCRGVDLKNIAWVWIQQPFVHIWHWSPKSLKRLLEENEFEVLEIKTRDTWDANTIYDGYLQYGFERYINKIASFVDGIMSKVIKRKISFFEEKIAFYFIEMVRILSYMINWSFSIFSNKAKGAELIVLCKKR